LYRPFYETKQDKKNEREIARILEKRWKCRLEKLPIKYGFDYAALRGESVVCWIEIKCKKNSTDRYKSFLLSLDKWMVAKELLRYTDIPCILAVKFTDKIMWRKFNMLEKFHIGFLRYGIKGRNDPNDKQPSAFIPMEFFQEVNPL
jgi:hypothetical protein